MPDHGPNEDAEAAALRAEVEQLRRERDALKGEVDGVRSARGGRSRVRTVATVVLVVVSVVAFAAAVPGAWTRRTVFDTDRYVELTSEIAAEPAVQARLAVRITDATFTALDVEARLASVLADVREELAFLAGPITEAVRERVQMRVEQLLASDAFQQLWAEANRVAHTQILAVLNGDTDTVQIEGDTVVLNTLPIVNEALKGLAGLASELAGRDVQFPEITAETVPSEAVTRLESALGVDLPDDLGAIEVYDADEVREVQQAVNLFDRGVVLFVLLWLVTAIAALAVSQHRRRTLLQLFTAFAVILVIERRFAIATVNGVVDGLDPEAQAAGRAIVDVLLGSLLTYTAWLLAIAFVVILVALLTGPYGWAVRLRRGVAEVGGAAVGMVRGTEAGPTARWIAPRRDLLMFGGAAIYAVILLLFDINLVWFLVLSVILAVYEIAVWRTAASLAPPVEPA
jgi:hypothetical protein